MNLSNTEAAALGSLTRQRGNPQAVASRLHGDYTNSQLGVVKRAINKLVMWGLVKNNGGIYEVVANGNAEQGAGPGRDPEAPTGDVARDPLPGAEGAGDDPDEA